MLEDLRDDYTGAYDATFKAKLADYEDTIKELISIEEGSDYFSPPPIEGRDEFYIDIKNDVKQ